MSKSNEKAMRLALEALETCTPEDTSTSHVIYAWHDEKLVNKAIKALEAALLAHKALAQSQSDVKQEQSAEHVGEPVVLEPAPKNSLPTFKECRRIITNHEFRERAKAGLEGQVLDTPRTTPIPTALHKFIYEYDDADPYKSTWFMHRLECVLKEATTPYVATQRQQRKPLTDEQKDKMQRAYLQSPSPNDWWLMSEEDRQVEAYLQGVRDTEAAHGITSESDFKE